MTFLRGKQLPGRPAHEAFARLELDWSPTRPLPWIPAAQALWPGADADPAPAATAEASELEQLYAHLEEMLLAVGFVRAETAAHQMRMLRQLCARARPSPAEVTQLRGICRQVLWAARRPGPGAV